jgi:7,8-dihydropterin-6-yl-methyl-4-(beta-D-ribofuranosyl)aminobenzene 5'-phosphate synthase
MKKIFFKWIKMKITTLIENKNTENPELISEHGLSLFIEKNGKKILFDTGSSGIFTENARKLSIDISAVDLTIISHGHYDHGGGLKAFFM